MMKNRENGIKRYRSLCSSMSSLMYSLVVVSSISPAIAAAATGGEHGGASIMDWVWRILNFAILVAILYFFAKFMNIKGFFQQRKELIEKSIRESQEAKELALKALAEVEERLKLKDKEVADIVAMSSRAGEQEKARLIAEGERLKEKILEHAKANIDYETKKAKEAIKAEAVEAAVELAEEKIKAKLTKEDQEKLFDNSFKLLERNQ